MNVKVTVLNPPPPPPKRIVIEMSEECARTLYDVTRYITGSPGSMTRWSRRAYTEELQNALRPFVAAQTGYVADMHGAIGFDDLERPK